MQAGGRRLRALQLLVKQKTREERPRPLHRARTEGFVEADSLADDTETRGAGIRSTSSAPSQHCARKARAKKPSRPLSAFRPPSSSSA